MLTFQQVILTLQDYWGAQGCALLQPYDMEVGAGTSHTATFLRALGPEPWRAAYVQPSRRPKDGRYGENPNRMQHYYQFQVVLKPSPTEHPRSLPRVARKRSASTSRRMMSALSRTTGKIRRWARGASAGKCGSTAWKSRSSPTFSRWAARLQSDHRRNHLRTRAHSDVPANVENRSSISCGRRRKRMASTQLAYRDVFLPERGRAVDVQLRAVQRAEAVRAVRAVRKRGQTAAGGQASAARATK